LDAETAAEVYKVNHNEKLELGSSIKKFLAGIDLIQHFEHKTLP
jgi:hypothetical protein